MNFHEGQILRISNLRRLARVWKQEFSNNGDTLCVSEVREGGFSHSYAYYRQVASDQWRDSMGEPILIELIKDAPKPYRPGEEGFAGEMMIAIAQGYGSSLSPSDAGAFVETVREHVVTASCMGQWKALALSHLRGGRANVYEPRTFIEHITALNEECNKIYVRLQESCQSRGNELRSEDGNQ